jgi:arylsulfatase A-like enzyme
MLTNHHTGTVCAITRSMLISGTDHHLVGEGTMGVPTDERKGLPGYEGYLNDRALSVAQLLKDGGYHTYMAGKWHIGSGIVGSTTGGGQTPDQWGFEHSYALLRRRGDQSLRARTGELAELHRRRQIRAARSAGTTGRRGRQPRGVLFDRLLHPAPDLVHRLEQTATASRSSPMPPTRRRTGRCRYPSLTCSKYKGKYDAGYDAIRNARIARQKALGIIPNDFVPYGGASETLDRGRGHREQRHGEREVRERRA